MKENNETKGYMVFWGGKLEIDGCIFSEGWNVCTDIWEDVSLKLLIKNRFYFFETMERCFKNCHLSNQLEIREMYCETNRVHAKEEGLIASNKIYIGNKVELTEELIHKIVRANPHQVGRAFWFFEKFLNKEIVETALRACPTDIRVFCHKQNDFLTEELAHEIIKLKPFTIKPVYKFNKEFITKGLVEDMVENINKPEFIKFRVRDLLECGKDVIDVEVIQKLLKKKPSTLEVVLQKMPNLLTREIVHSSLKSIVPELKGFPEFL